MSRKAYRDEEYHIDYFVLLISREREASYIAFKRRYISTWSLASGIAPDERPGAHTVRRNKCAHSDPGGVVVNGVQGKVQGSEDPDVWLYVVNCHFRPASSATEAAGFLGPPLPYVTYNFNNN